MDAIRDPKHYARWPMQPLDFIRANHLDFVTGNIIKYVMRYDCKNGLEDLKKAKFYLDCLIEDIKTKAEKENNGTAKG